MSLIFGVIKAWLARGKTLPQSAKIKQKISQSGIVNIGIEVNIRKD